MENNELILFYVLRMFNNDIILFYVLKILIIVMSGLVVTIRNPVQSVLLLVGVYLLTAMELFLLELEFLAFIYVTLYVGAVTILFIFVVMLLDIQPTDEASFRPFYIYFTFLLLCCFAFELGLYYISSFSLQNLIFTTIITIPFDASLQITSLSESFSHTHLIGIYIFTLAAFPLYILGFVLLVALIGPILLTLSHDKSNRRQTIHEQNSRSVTTSILLFSKTHKT